MLITEKQFLIEIANPCVLEFTLGIVIGCVLELRLRIVVGPKL